MFLAFLRQRYASPLFRLPNAAAISAQMRLLNTGPNQASLPFFFPSPDLLTCLGVDWIALDTGVRFASHDHSLLL